MTCKVVKPYAYTDANNKPGKSAMDVNAGDSKLVFIVPKGVTASTPAIIKITCVGNVLQLPFNTTE